MCAVFKLVSYAEYMLATNLREYKVIGLICRIGQADQAFTHGMAHGLLIASIVMVATAVVALIMLPTRVRPYKEPAARQRQEETAAQRV